MKVSAKKQPLRRKKLPGISHCRLIGGDPRRGEGALVYAASHDAGVAYAMRFLADGIVQSGENGVFVTFEKSPRELRRAAAGFGWNVRKWEKKARWAFVDGTAPSGCPPVVSGNYDLGALLARIKHAVLKVKAKRLSFDSLDGVFDQFSDSIAVRAGLFAIAVAMKEMEVSVVMITGGFAEDSEIVRYGTADLFEGNVVKLGGVLKGLDQSPSSEIFTGELSRVASAEGLLPAG